MKSMRAHQFGGPEQLRFEDAPDPQPQAGQVHGAEWITSSRGRCSGKGRLAGFCASVAASIAAEI